MKAIGERIKSRRKLLGLTQEDLGKAAGVGQSTIADLERGRSETTAKSREIVKALGCSHDWLTTGEDVATDLPPPDTPPLNDDQIRALAYLENMTPSQRAEWFQWAEDKERQNREVREYFIANQAGKVVATGGVDAIIHITPRTCRILTKQP